MSFQHYFELFKRHYQLILLIAGGITLCTAALSTLLLFVTPLYRSTARVTILPTQAELIFTQRFLQGSTYNPADLMVQTHIEHLLSRPVAERTLEKLMANTPVPEPEPEAEEGWKADLKALFQSTLRRMRVIYNILNAGEYVEPPFREVALDDLRDAIDVRTIEGSFILELVASTSSPQASSLIANSLAEAYVDRNRDVVGLTAASLTDYLRQEIEARQRELDTLFSQEIDLRDSLDVVDPSNEIGALTRLLDQERLDLQSDAAAAAELGARIAALRDSGSAYLRQGRLEDGQILLQQALQDQAAAEGRLVQRRSAVAEMEARLRRLHEHELTLSMLQRQSDQTKEEMSDLRSRIVDVELSKASAIGQVRIIDPAIAPTYPTFPRVATNTAAAAVAGLLLAGFVLVLIDTFSSTVKTTSDMRRLVGERFLGAIPRAILRLTDKGAGPKRAEIADFTTATGERLTLLGPIDQSWITVIGVGDEQTARGGAVAIAAAHAAADIPAVIQFGSLDRQRVVMEEDALRMTPLPPDEGPSPGDVSIMVTTLKPSAPRLSGGGIGDRDDAERNTSSGELVAKPLLVFAVKAGRTSESFLQALVSASGSRAGGQPFFLFVG
jgi:polysaccharide biosynthesis transport protein